MALATQMSAYQIQLNNRINQVRNSNGYLGAQIMNEASLKSRRVANSIRQFAHSESGSEYLTNGVRVFGNTASAIFSVAKTPIMVTLRLAGLAVPVLTTIIVISWYLFSKLINPDSKYNGQLITNMGKEVGNFVTNGLNASNDFIRRM